jgi:peptidoglycan/LPS O-acetylase OafA/YrhL
MTGRPDHANFPCFDGLRAIAALSVLLTHTAFISGYSFRSNTWGPYLARMDIGVAVFFVISGFLLYRPFCLARFADRPPPDARAYTVRRALRIFPAYWFAFTAVLVVPALKGHDVGALGPMRLLAHYGLFHIYAPSLKLLPVQQAWTLATEISFYAFLPLWALCIRRGPRGTSSAALRSELIGVGALYAFGLVFRLALRDGPHAGVWRGVVNLWLPARIDHFAIGMALAALSAWWTTRGDAPRWTEHPAVPYLSWLLALVSFWVLCEHIGLRNNRGNLPFTNTQAWLVGLLWGFVGGFLVVPAVLGPQDRSLVRRLLRVRPLAALGVVSYGIYLWHESALDWYLRREHLIVPGRFPTPSAFGKMTAFVFIVTLVLAVVTHVVVERPAMNLGRSYRRSVSAGRTRP